MKFDPGLIHRLFYPQVPLVMAASAAGRVSAMPVVSYASVSDSPPLVAVACLPGGYTYSLAVKAGSFSLSLLDKKDWKALQTLASVSGAAVKDKIRVAGLRHHPSSVSKAPLISRAMASLECRVESHDKTGDHNLLIGKVLEARVSRGFTDYWDFKAYRPILYAGWQDGLNLYR